MRETVPTQNQRGGIFLNNLIDDPKKMLKEIKALKKGTHIQKLKDVKDVKNVQTEEYNK